MKPIALVVDDNPVNRKILEAALRQIADIRMAADGVEALDEIETHRPDVVFLDLMMPRLDGFGVMAKLHAANDELLSRTVVVSAMVDDETRKTCLKNGVKQFLAKPLMLKDAIDAFSSIVATLPPRTNDGAAAA